MSSFQTLWENMQADRSDKEDKSMSAIRTGIGVRENFWDDFLSVINNSDGLSELLEIPVTKIASWHSRVREALDKVKKADATPEPKDTNKLIKTGLPEFPESPV